MPAAGFNAYVLLWSCDDDDAEDTLQSHGVRPFGLVGKISLPDGHRDYRGYVYAIMLDMVEERTADLAARSLAQAHPALMGNAQWPGDLPLFNLDDLEGDE